MWGVIYIACFVLGALARAYSNKKELFLQPTADFIFGKNDPIEEIEIYDDIPQEVGTSYDWDQICYAAIKKAKNGDSGARTWVTKHVYKKQEASKPLRVDKSPRVDKPPRADKPPKETKKETPPLTSARVVEDAVMFLCCLGEKKRKVDPIIKDLSTKKKYEKVEDLVKDFYKRS